MIILESIGDIGGVVLTSGGDVKTYDVTCIATMPNIYFVEGILGKKNLNDRGQFSYILQPEELPSVGY